MSVDNQPLDDRYIWHCRKHNVPPNPSVLSSIHNFQLDVRRSCHELHSLGIILDHIKDVDFSPLHDFLKEIDFSKIEAVDIFNKSSCALNGEYALSLMRVIDHKLRLVDLRDVSFGKDFLRDLSKRGLPCQVLNLRSSHFRKLNISGKFLHMHTLNLDFSTSLSCFREECFACMPNLACLSMCDTRISNLWTTIAALSKLPSLVELRFQNWVCCNETGQQQNGGSYIGELDQPNSSTEEAFRDLFSLSSAALSHDAAAEDSSDDSEVDFSGHQQVYGLINQLSTVISELNGQDDLHSEVALSPLFSPGEEETLEAAKDHMTYIASKYISSHASPICFEKHYREYMITSLPNLKVLDNLPIRDIDREPASTTFTQHFESLPYRRKHKESVVSILHKREIKASNTYTHAHGREPSYPSGQSRYSYTRSLCAAKVGSSAWPFLQPLSISGSGLGDEGRNFRPRQFEYHPSNSSLMVFGTLDGEVVVLNHENGKIVGCIPSLGAMNSVLGLCWLKSHPSKLIAGSDNGSINLYDIKRMAPTIPGTYSGINSTTFVEFEQLTSVHVNSSDELFLASGYSRNVSLYDIGSGKRLQVFTDMHHEHINVVKFANHSPSLFATSSFDQDVKMWDLRQKPIRPCYTASSSKGNVMVCFSPDDHYLLASAVDNEVKQLLAVDGRLHMDFAIPPTGSTQNYTRSYYMNGRDYIVTGSCDEHVVRICCAQTGRRLKDISLEGKGSGTSMFVQSLRGDPFRHFNMSILAAYMRPSSKSEIFKVNLLASSDYAKEGSSSQNPHPSMSMGA